MTDQGLEELTRQARAALGGAGRRRDAAHGDATRFELFHAARSICSQKVRTVLAYHDLPYVEHGLDIFLGQTYLPDYVRLRMLGCEQHGGALASHHSGDTSLAAGGCDGAVVPTLIDWRTDQVIVDSKRICIHLDDQAPPANSLRPADLAAEIDEQLRIVDELPNYQMLMGRPASGGESMATRDGVNDALSRKKVAWCDAYLRDHAGDEVLVAAYTAKRAKELSAANGLFSAAAMRSAYQRAEHALAALDGRLAARRTRWLHREAPTLSDLFWGVELLRMQNVGLAQYWEDGRLRHVEQFLADTASLNAIRVAVVDWPGATF